MNRSRLLSIIKKEFVHIRRDRPSLVIAFMMPVMMILLFGYTVNTDVDNIRLSVWDSSMTEESRELAEAFLSTDAFMLEKNISSYRDAAAELDSGRSQAVLVIPADYHETVVSGRQGSVQMLLDGADPNVARTALNYGMIIGNNYSIKVAGGTGSIFESGGFTYEPRVWYNPEMKSLNFNIPGLLGLILQNITVMLTAFSIVREREMGTLEQIMITPVRKTELMVGKMVPYIVIAFIDIFTTLVIAVFWFGVEINGSFTLLLLLSLTFLVAALGIGLYISTISKTQLQAMQMTLAFILPSVLLSGFIFPRDTMPAFIGFLGNLIPLTYFLEILRGIIIKGTGIEYLWKQTLMLAFFSAGIIGMAVIRFRKKLD